MMTTTRGASLPADDTAGALLRRWRVRAMLTQEELAARAGVDSRTVRRLEGDDQRRPRTSTLRRVADALGLGEDERSRLRAALDRGVTRSGAAGESPRDTRPVPRELPAGSTDFVGRTAEAGYLLGGRGGAAVLAIDGMAGIGKTTLAIQVAHATASAYPDGQLFVDLHGASARPLDPAEALGRLLRSLDVPGEAVPPGLDARAAMFRSRIARRRVLVLLDDAAAERQVVPLLPGAGDSLVIVTSRRRLAGLDRARTVSLDGLPEADAARLFVDSAESHGNVDEAAETVELCGRVPLAIRVAAARLRSRPTWTLADLNARLRADGRLDELVAGARGMSAALDISAEQLPEPHRRAYDLLGLMTGPDVGLEAASALLGLDPRHARPVLDALVEFHLLDERAPDRFGMHDLVREHARRRAATGEWSKEAPAAVRRLLDHYVAATAAMARAAYPYVPIPLGQGSADLEVPTDRRAARRWLDLELDNLLAGAASAWEDGLYRHAVDLSVSLDQHLVTTARHRPALALHQSAVCCARRSADRVAEALALSRLAFVRHRLESFDQADVLYRRGVTLARDADSGYAMATALVGLANVRRMREDYAGARSRLSEALALARSAPGAPLLSEVLVHLGHLHRQAGDVGAADEYLTEALELTRRDGNARLGLYALLGRGWIRSETGHDDEAEHAFSQALELARAEGHLAGEAAVRLGLGYVRLRRDDPVRATAHFQEVEQLADRLGSRNWRLEALLGCALACREADPARTVDLGTEALAIAQAMDQRHDVVRAHDVVAGALARLGDRAGAADHWDRALEQLAELGVDQVPDDDTSVASIARQRALLDDD